MNLLNQKLRAVRIQIAVYTKKIQDETNPQQINNLQQRLSLLTEEEDELLKQLGAFE